MTDQEEKNQGTSGSSTFKVSDRRKFSSKGEPVEDAGESPEVEFRQEIPSAQESGSSEEATSTEERSEETVDFAGFLLSLATSAVAHLGEVPDPATGQKVENLEAARQMIDIIAMLQEKTDGNLTSDEAQLLESLLYELRMKFLSKKKVISL